MECMASDTETNILYWIIYVLVPACWFLIKHISCGSLVRWKAEQLVNRQRETHVFYPYSIVSSFAFEGSDAIECYSDGLALIEIFNLGPFIDSVSDGVVVFLEYTAEEKEGLEWAGKRTSDWNYTKDVKTLMKEIEDKTLSR